MGLAAHGHLAGCGGWDGVAAAGPFVPCYQKELKAEIAFSW